MSYTLVTHVDRQFDSYPAYEQGGPAMVVIDQWAVSYETLDSLFSSPSVVAAHDGKVTLRVRRIQQNPYTSTPHPTLDGTKWDTQRDARRAAYEAGVIAFFVKDES